jgi:hypothetical protein
MKRTWRIFKCEENPFPPPKNHWVVVFEFDNFNAAEKKLARITRSL